MDRVRIGAIVASVFCLAGSLDGAPVPKELREAKFYFPVAAGTKWVRKAGADVSTFAVDQVKEEAGKYVVDTGVEGIGCGNASSRYHVSRHGVWYLLGYSDMIEKPIPVQRLKLPFRKGETWTAVVGENDVEAFRYEFTSAAEEPVTVTAGKFQAIRVDWAKVVKGERTSSGSDWYAPNVGVVKATFRSPQDPRGAWGRGAGWSEDVRTTELRAFFPPGAATRETHKQAVEAAGGEWHDLMYPYKK